MKRRDFLHMRLAQTPETASYPNAIADAKAFADLVHAHAPFEGEPAHPKPKKAPKKGRRT